jgi:hypothetical protein
MFIVLFIFHLVIFIQIIFILIIKDFVFLVAITSINILMILVIDFYQFLINYLSLFYIANFKNARQILIDLT